MRLRHLFLWTELICCCSLAACRQAGAPAPAARPVTMTFPTAGMTCHGCEETIRQAVGQLAGVQSVEPSHRDKTTRVTFDAARVRPEAIVAAINQAGYQARLPAP